MSDISDNDSDVGGGFIADDKSFASNRKRKTRASTKAATKN